jgi:hypothetical protein
MNQYDLLRLPWEIQLALASGYAAYVVAYTGMRERQRTIDIAFISLVFSLVATLVLWLLSSQSIVIASVAAFIASVLAGAAWRKFGRPLTLAALRAGNVTWSDDEPSALATLSCSTKFYVSQIAVLLDDGTWLSCKDTAPFADAPFGPCQIGPNGDVAMYLTHEEPPGGEEREVPNVRNVAYGDRVTYIPASKIKRITLRHTAKSIRPSLAEETSARPAPSPLEQGEPSAAQ